VSTQSLTHVLFLLLVIFPALLLALDVPVTKPPPAIFCHSKHSPAKNQTALAYAAFKNAKLYMLGSIINAEPTHSQLQKAAEWQLNQTEKIFATAVGLNAKDENTIRRDWYKFKLHFLKTEMKIARYFLKKGLPSCPWLGKVYNWLKDQFEKVKAGWHKFWNKVTGKTDPPATPPAAPAKPTTTVSFDGPIPPTITLKPDDGKPIEAPKTDAGAAGAATDAAAGGPAPKKDWTIPESALIMANDGPALAEDTNKSLGNLDAIIKELDNTSNLC